MPGHLWSSRRIRGTTLGLLLAQGVVGCTRDSQVRSADTGVATRAIAAPTFVLTPEDTARVAGAPSDCDPDVVTKVHHWQRSTGLLTRVRTGGSGKLDRESATLAEIMARDSAPPTLAELSDADGATVGYLALDDSHLPLFDKRGLYCIHFRYDQNAPGQPGQPAALRGWTAKAWRIKGGAGPSTEVTLTIVSREVDNGADEPPNVGRFVFLAPWARWIGGKFAFPPDSTAFGGDDQIGDGGWLRCANGCCSFSLEF